MTLNGTRIDQNFPNWVGVRPPQEIPLTPICVNLGLVPK